MNHLAVEGFSVIVGEDHCRTDAGTLKKFTVDGVEPRCVVMPRSEDEVARVLRRATDLGLAVIPCCSGTKLEAGAMPRRYDLALNLSAMTSIHSFEPGDLTVSAEPGVTLDAFQKYLQPNRLWAPFDSPGGVKASLGGIVSANASGPLRLKYGSPRDVVLGMRIVTADGRIIKTGGQVVKNVAGYDLARLLTGSFGTLGVIVEISLKLFPLPAGRSTWRIEAPNLDSAHEFRRQLLLSPLGPARMALLDWGAAALARSDALTSAAAHNYQIYTEFFGSERVLARCGQTVVELARSAGALAEPVNGEDAAAAWDRIIDITALLAATYPNIVGLKTMLPIASGEAFMDLAAGEARKLGVPCACVCQNGAGILRACLIPGAEGMAELPEPLLRDLSGALSRLRAQALERGGALVIERCSPGLKKHFDVWGPAGSDFALMHKLKDLWDPKGTLSPGRFIGGL